MLGSTTNWILKNALIQFYPSVKLSAFWYQFALAIRRKCKTIPNLYESIWMDDTSSLIHQFLCLPLLKQSDVADGLNILKRNANDIESIKPVVEIVESFVRREGMESISIEWEYFGKQCDTNHNESLRSKFLINDCKFSLFYLLKTMVTEQITTEKAFDRTDVPQHKFSPQVTQIKRI